MTSRELHEKTALLTLFRLAVALVLIVAVFLFGARGDFGFLSPSTADLVYGAVTGLLLLCAVSAMLLERWTDKRRVRGLAYVQFAGDSLFATALVLLTGGCDSVFTFLYSLAIINAGVVLYRRGAMFAATANGVCLSFIAMGQTRMFGDRFFDFVAAGNFFGDSAALAREFSEVFPAYAVNLLAFFGIAVLSGFLAGQLRAADVIAKEHQSDFLELANLHENIVSSLENGLMTVSMGRTIIHANSTACRMVGRDRENVLGRSVDELFPDVGRVLGNPDKTAGSRSETTVQMLRGCKTYLRWNISPLKNSLGERVGHILMFFDITHLKEMEAQVQRAERMAVLGRLAANIAHEIRNPLASMSGSIQLLRKTMELDGSDRKLMDIVVRETENLNHWISEFLDYARPIKLEVNAVDMAAMVREVAEMLRHDERTSGIEIRCESDESCVIQGDRGRLRLVIWNLAINAVEAVPPGGIVVLEVREDEDTVTFRVADSGPGVSPENAVHIFEPFFTTKKGGTGLGLATVHRLVEEHQGHILVQASGMESGTAFVVVLPKRRPAPGVPPDSVVPGR